MVVINNRPAGALLSRDRRAKQEPFGRSPRPSGQAIVATLQVKAARNRWKGGAGDLTAAPTIGVGRLKGIETRGLGSLRGRGPMLPSAVGSSVAPWLVKTQDEGGPAISGLALDREGPIIQEIESMDRATGGGKRARRSVAIFFILIDRQVSRTRGLTGKVVVLVGLSDPQKSKVLRKYHHNDFNSQLDDMSNVWVWVVLVVPSGRLTVDALEFALVAVLTVVPMVMVHLPRPSPLSRLVHHVYQSPSTGTGLGPLFRRYKEV